MPCHRHVVSGSDVLPPVKLAYRYAFYPCYAWTRDWISLFLTRDAPGIHDGQDSEEPSLDIVMYEMAPLNLHGMKFQTDLSNQQYQ